MAIETVPMDDKELFSAAMTDEAPIVEATPEPVAETAQPDGQPRDEHGRFAPKAEEAPQADAAPTQQQPKPEDEGGQVPSWRHRELREERDAFARRAEEIERNATAYQHQMAAMQRQLAELQKPKTEPVDFFADPNAAFKQQITPLEEQFAQFQAETRMDNSRAIAVARHGWDAVAEMEKAVAEAMRANDPGINTLRGQLATSRDPVGTAMGWYSNQKVIKETGGDIGKFREKILADAMKDPAFQAKVIESARGQANSGAPPIKLPPSLNKTAGSGGATASELSAEDMSDRALFKQAVNSR